MQTKFKRHQAVKFTHAPNPEYIEYYEEKEEPITPGMTGKINILLPNGQYHVEINNAKGKIIAYAPFNEEDLEAL